MQSLVVAAAVLWATGGGPGRQKEREALQGTWQVVGLEAAGRAMPAYTYRGLTVVIAGDRITFRTRGGSRKEATFKLDPSARPRAIDLTFVGGKHKGKARRGVYALEGDTLRLCTDAPGRERPTALATRAGTAQALLTLRRAK
jgi:uncharacterized protein (TIGR03067 family)